LVERAARGGGIERALLALAMTMSNTFNTATEEKEQWRARIILALAELRGDDLASGKRGDDERDDGATSD
jgi:hypothetical protein